MAEKYTFSFIGAGKVAWNMSQALDKAGHKINEVYSRTLSSAEQLTSRLYGPVATDNPDLSQSRSDIFIISVPDHALEELTEKLIIPEGRTVAHTSGTSPLSVLRKFEPGSGVFYPLQTFSKDREPDFQEIPIFIESKDNDTEKILTEVSVSITKHTRYLNSEKRKALHTGAVFACNFVNHLFVQAEKVLEKENIDFSLFSALINETTAKALELGPRKSQTGPAVREDMNTVNQHLQYLENNPIIKNIYQTLSDSIITEKKNG